MLVRYLREDETRARGDRLEQISAISNGDVEAVASRLPHLALWSDVANAEGVFSVEDDDGAQIDVTYRLPVGYAPDRAVPVLLCLGGEEVLTDGMISPRGAVPPSAFSLLRETAVLLAAQADDVLLIAPSRHLGGSLWQPPGTTDGTRAVLRETRRRFHVDERRVYLFGSGEAAAAAWMTALAYPDLFAAVITDGTGPDLPYPSVTARLLAPNLASSTVLVTVGPVIHEDRCDVPDELFLDTISQAGRAIGLRLTTFPRTGPDGQPVEAMSGAALSARRVPLPRHVSHWFRYPEHGRAYWLRGGKLREPIWEAEALSIRAAPGTDRDEFIARVLRSKLGWIEGRVEGNTIRVRTSRVGEVDVFFPPGLVDLSQPVTVECNGRRRFRGMVEPDLRTMLELARSEWTFTEVPVATRRFSLKSDEIPDPEWKPR
jgi:pimeloyl-ACP methyl ester carboxylesterase